jgi:cardiolipin synthase A/B
MDFLLQSPILIAVAHALIVIIVTVRVIMSRPATGSALAWLLLVTLLPFVGALIYFLIGERRIGRLRIKRIGTLRSDFKDIADAVVLDSLTHVDWSCHAAAARAMDQLGRMTVGSATVHGSSFRLFRDTQEMLRGIALDVDNAQTSVLMEFYIWNEGGTAEEVLEAVIRAAKRGVSCRVLVDAIGGRPWWKGGQPGRLREAGVDVRPALPVGLFRTFVGRSDLRLHRKIVIIDGETAWTGSMNLVDPRYFKQNAGVGQWVDAMVRVQGAVVVPLAAVMIGDWVVETGEAANHLIESAGLHLVKPTGNLDIQVIPSGPGETDDGLLLMLLALINAARETLVLTTPYLVPDDSMLKALRGAALRGVNVSLIVPEKVDSLLTRYASRSYYADLLDAGVKIYRYRGGLLHTKSIMADNALSMFGTVNLDLRSLWLDYEVALFIYGAEFARELHDLHKTYIQDSDLMDPAAWKARPFRQRFLENMFRLVSPLL